MSIYSLFCQQQHQLKCFISCWPFSPVSSWLTAAFANASNSFQPVGKGVLRNTGSPVIETELREMIHFWWWVMDVTEGASARSLAGTQMMHHAGREEKKRNCFITFQGVSCWTDIRGRRGRAAIRGWWRLDLSEHHFDGVFQNDEII